MNKKQKTLILVIIAVIAIIIINKGTGRQELITGPEDTISFTYTWTYKGGVDGKNAIQSPDISIGIYDFKFPRPEWTCSVKNLVFPVRYRRGITSSNNNCWLLRDFNWYDGYTIHSYSLTSEDANFIISPYLELSYQPQQLTYRKKDINNTTKYYIDDSLINYVFTIKQASKLIKVSADAPKKIGLGEELIVNVHIRNELCGGRGGIIIDDNVVILNQWYTNKQITFDYSDCDQDLTFTMPADKLGRHDMTISAYMLLPEAIGGGIESKTKSTLSYEVVKDYISETTSTPTSTTLFIRLSERESSQEAEVSVIPPPAQREPITTPPNATLRIIAILLLIGSGAGIIIINRRRTR